MKHFEIEIQKLNYIYDNLLSGLIAVPLLSAILFYSYYGIVDTKHLYIWFVSNLIVILFRAFLLSSYRKATITQNNFLFYYKTFFVFSFFDSFFVGEWCFFYISISSRISNHYTTVCSGTHFWCFGKYFVI